MGYYLTRALLKNGHEVTIIESNSMASNMIARQVDCQQCWETDQEHRCRRGPEKFCHRLIQRYSGTRALFWDWFQRRGMRLCGSAWRKG